MTIQLGKRYGHLIVLRTTEATALCCCVCQHSCRVSVAELESGAVTSCGCRAPTESMRANFYSAREERTRQRDFKRMWNGR
jgi:hypothetical protein